MNAEIHPSLVDHAKIILANAPISNDERADIWEVWHDAHSVSDLARRLTEFNIPEQFAIELLEAKTLSQPEDPGIAAINRMATIPESVLDLAEKHPTVLRALVNAATNGK